MLILLFAILRNPWRLDSKCYISFLVNTTLFCIYIAYDIWHGFSFYCKNWWWWYCTSTILCRNFIHFRFIFDYFEYCTECTLCLLHRIPRKFSFFFSKKSYYWTILVRFDLFCLTILQLYVCQSIGAITD